jgi:D,D-heptose 1,7-bisphosphate phosphatase
MTHDSLYALVLTDENTDPTQMDLVNKILTKSGHIKSHHLKMNSYDKTSFKACVQNITASIVLLIDARHTLFLMDYTHIKTMTYRGPVLFLKYDPVPTQLSVRLDETGYIHPIKSEHLKDWADTFSSAKTALLSQKDLESRIVKSNNLDDLFSSLISDNTCYGVVMPELKQQSKPCLFLDRDGIINEDTSYISRSEDLKIIPDVLPLIAWAKKQGWYVIIVSNQSGVARGKFSTKDLENLHLYLIDILKKKDAEPDACFYCPYYPEGVIAEYSLQSVSRKPSPGLLLQAASQFPIQFSMSYMIGDKDSDCISLAGLKSLLVKGRYPLSLQNNPIFNDLKEVLSYLKSKPTYSPTA